MELLPLFSIVVPTYNRPRELAACLQALVRLDYPHDRYEVIVVDDGSASPTRGLLRGSHCRLSIEFVKQEHRGPAAARNAGAARATGEFVAFTADDCLPHKNWLNALAARFAANPDLALGGRVVNGLLENPYSAATHLLIDYLYRYYNSSKDNARFFTPNNLALRAKPFLNIGGFDPSFDLGAGEDREFCDRWLRHGFRMVYVAEASVSHSHHLSFYDFLRLHVNYGRGTRRYRAMLASRYGHSVRLEPLRFYANLLTAPFQNSMSRRAVALSMLLAISQAANAAGYFWERRNSRLVSAKDT